MNKANNDQPFQTSIIASLESYHSISSIQHWYPRNLFRLHYLHVDQLLLVLILLQIPKHVIPLIARGFPLGCRGNPLAIKGNPLTDCEREVRRNQY